MLTVRVTEPDPYFDVSDTEIDSALALCGGDPREAIRALLVGQAYLERQVTGLQASVSSGYRRRRIHPAHPEA